MEFPTPIYWKKNIFFPSFFYVFIMFSITQFGENFKQKIIFCLKIREVWTFLDELDHSDHLCNFLEKKKKKSQKKLWKKIQIQLGFKYSVSLNSARTLKTKLLSDFCKKLR